jgi:hypothetical protein
MKVASAMVFLAGTTELVLQPDKTKTAAKIGKTNNSFFI